MAKPCSVCVHPRRDEIDEGLVRRDPYRKLKTLYEVSESALSRHLNRHILPYVARIRAGEDADRAARMVRRIDELTRETREVLEASKIGKERDLDRVLKAITRLERQLELEAKIEKVISDAPTVNVFNSPQWHIIIETTHQALEPFPEARSALADALVELEESGRVDAGADGAEDEEEGEGYPWG